MDELWLTGAPTRFKSFRSMYTRFSVILFTSICRLANLIRFRFKLSLSLSSRLHSTIDPYHSVRLVDQTQQFAHWKTPSEYWFGSDESGDGEVQRPMLELLNQLDGFSSDERIKACQHVWFTSVY